MLIYICEIMYPELEEICLFEYLSSTREHRHSWLESISHKKHKIFHPEGQAKPVLLLNDQIA